MELTSALDVQPTAARPRVDRQAGSLRGTRCGSCGAASWPARAVCQACGSPDVAPTTFAPSGRLLTYTRVWVARPGLEAPYTLGQVHVDDGPIVFGHVRGYDDGPLPAAVVVVIDDDPQAVPPFWFEPGR